MPTVFSFMLCLPLATMNRWFVLFAVCSAVSGIDARPQQPYILKPNGQIIPFVGNLPVPFMGQNQKPVVPMASPMLLGLPVPLAGSVIPLALWPYFNQFNPSFISSVIYKPRTSTPVPISTSTGLDPGNEITTIIPMKSEETTAALTTATQTALPIPTVVTGTLAGAVSQAVTQPSASTQVYSTLPPSLTMPTTPVITVQREGDYEFEYSVNNRETGDIKSHGEKRLNGVVTGYYSLVDADGMLRKVNYTADANGFRATVNRLPITSH